MKVSDATFSGTGDKFTISGTGKAHSVVIEFGDGNYRTIGKFRVQYPDGLISDAELRGGWSLIENAPQYMRDAYAAGVKRMVMEF